VGGSVLSTLARLAERRFSSFSEAADRILDLVEAELPPGSVLLGQVAWDEGELRLLDARGDAARVVHPGSALRLADSDEGRHGGLLHPEELRSMAVGSYLAVPLETSGGGGAITLCALSAGTDVYARSHLDLLAVAGRLLTYEWETVRWRADLRRLNERLRDPERTDQVTGLHNRATLIDELAREWPLAQRGSTESHLVVCRLANLAEVTRRHGNEITELLLRDAAGVMEEALRQSDHAGRVAEDLIAAVLVGCKGREGAEAFFERYRQALARVTDERPARLELAHAVRALGGPETAEAALETTEAEARAAAPTPAGALTA
jgi:diguanylate cyclase (GGDEF)-like protein